MNRSLPRYSTWLTPSSNPLRALPAAIADVTKAPDPTQASPALITDFDGAIATLTLNRPDSYNALSEQLLDELTATLDDLAPRNDIRVVILAANGKAFCAGHDLKQMRANDNRDYQHSLFSKCSAVMQQIRALPQPVIARVQGMATAAGCQLVATCDLALAADHCRFAVSGVNLGLFCSTPAVALSRNVSQKRSLEMLLTGDFIDAATALDYGLINRVTAADQLDTAVRELAGKIAAKPGRVSRLGKQLFYQQLALPLQDAYCIATHAISDNMMMDEAREGIDAFIEKRAPDWQG